MKTLEQYKQMLHEKGIWYLFTNFVRGVFGIVKWSNLKVRIREYGTYLYLQRYYKRGYNTIQQGSPIPPKIWICWFQGLDNAPLVVQKCVESVKTHCKEYEITVLTAENMYQYAEIPDFIKAKYELGIISAAHFSDVLRTVLLVKQGGIWIDATVMLTNKIPDNILHADFFCYQATMTALSKIKASNWFIVSQPNNPILCSVLDMLISYWKQNDKALDYFIFHLFFAIAVNRNAACKKIWQAMPKYANYKNHLLQAQLLNQFNKDIFENICLQTSVHKLTYKLPFEEKCKGSFYEFLMQH